MASARLAPWACLLVCMLSVLKTESVDVTNTIVKNAVEKGAVCLDGTPPAYALRKGSGEAANNWVIYLEKPWPTISHLPKILQPLMLLFKPVFQFMMLLWFLCVKIPAPDVFIVQNPPSVPTLLSVKWASWLRRSKFVVDWHNFGYTLLALFLGRSSPFVAVYRWFEKHYGKMANGSLCVTHAMQLELAQNWGIKATVLYDQPPEFFHPTLLEEKHKLFCRIDKNLNEPCCHQDRVSNDFYKWTRVYVRYCDGSSYVGDREEPFVGNNTTVYFRGARVFNAIMEDLLAKGMKSASNALLTGCSAGGLGALLQ